MSTIYDRAFNSKEQQVETSELIKAYTSGNIPTTIAKMTSKSIDISGAAGLSVWCDITTGSLTTVIVAAICSLTKNGGDGFEAGLPQVQGGVIHWQYPELTYRINFTADQRTIHVFPNPGVSWIDLWVLGATTATGSAANIYAARTPWPVQYAPYKLDNIYDPTA